MILTVVQKLEKAKGAVTAAAGGPVWKLPPKASVSAKVYHQIYTIDRRDHHHQYIQTMITTLTERPSTAGEGNTIDPVTLEVCQADTEQGDTSVDTTWFVDVW